MVVYYECVHANSKGTFKEELVCRHEECVQEAQRRAGKGFPSRRRLSL